MYSVILCIILIIFFLKKVKRTIRANRPNINNRDNRIRSNEKCDNNLHDIDINSFIEHVDASYKMAVF
jgi:hypothetical protein